MKNINETGSPDSKKENSPEQEKLEEILKKSKQFVVISGPSGSGKTMAIKHLVDRYGFIEPSFLTTRELRPGEQEIGGAHVDQDEFTKREAEQKIFLPARNYGNAYGYDLDIIFNSVEEGNNIVVEAPASNLITDVARFLPESTVVGMLPLTIKEIEEQLKERGLNNPEDRRIRIANSETEKEQIIHASSLMDISQIIPTHGVPQDTLSQIDKVMDAKGFEIKN